MKKDTKIARTVSLPNLTSGTYGYPEEVREVRVSGRSTVKEFVNLVFGKKEIEHLGRTDMVKAYAYRQTGSSLFFKSVHQAYSEHHALGLRPEVLMYLINSVVAETVKRYPDEYRDLFTTEPEKTVIQVRHDGLRRGDPTSPWNEAIGLFDSELRKRVPAGIMGEMLPELSTATNESEVASLLTFMDAASPFYDYRVMTLCGIPRIVLFGEEDDYRKTLEATLGLSRRFDKHLSQYFKNLLPVLDTILSTVSGGYADEDFWSQLYKHIHHSGTSAFSGWISTFLWYINEIGDEGENTLVIKPEYLFDWRSIEDGGIDSGSEPSHVSSIPFIWDYFGQEIPMTFIGGVLGIEVEDGAITPQLSYGILNS